MIWIESNHREWNLYESNGHRCMRVLCVSLSFSLFPAIPFIRPLTLHPRFGSNPTSQNLNGHRCNESSLYVCVSFPSDDIHSSCDRTYTIWIISNGRERNLQASPVSCLSFFQRRGTFIHPVTGHPRFGSNRTTTENATCKNLLSRSPSV
jgi:hypothetical protein